MCAPDVDGQGGLPGEIGVLDEADCVVNLRLVHLVVPQCGHQADEVRARGVVFLAVFEKERPECISVVVRLLGV